jgi:hypothetical protein
VDLVELTLLVGLLMLVSFVLGASVMWSLEGRERRFQPLWLMIVRNITMIWLGAWIFFRPGRGDTSAIVDPGIMVALGVFAVGASVLAFGLEVRHYRRQRRGLASGGRDAL